MNCGIAPDVSFFYSNLVPFPVLAKEGHPPCRSHILAVHSFQSFPDWGRAVTTHPQDARQPQLLVLFWFSCLKALAGQAGVWTWSLSCPGLAVPARGIVGQWGIALLSHRPGLLPHTIPSPLLARGSAIRHHHPACLSQRDSKVTVTPQGTKQLLQECRGDGKNKIKRGRL